MVEVSHERDILLVEGSKSWLACVTRVALRARTDMKYRIRQRQSQNFSGPSDVYVKKRFTRLVRNADDGTRK